MTLSEATHKLVTKQIDLSSHRELVPSCLIEKIDDLNSYLNVKDPGVCAEALIDVQELKAVVPDIFDSAKDRGNVDMFILQLELVDITELIL